MGVGAGSGTGGASRLGNRLHRAGGRLLRHARGEGEQAEERPRHRVLEERGVEEAVHGDRDQDNSCGERDARREAPAEAREGGEERGREKPAEEPEADDSLLGCDRHGHRVRGDPLRVPARDPEPTGVLVREASGSDPRDRVVEGDPDALAHEVGASRGDPVEARARLAYELVAHLRDGEHHDGGERADREERERRPAAPGDGHGDDDPGRERDEARLRERDEQPEPRRHHDGVEPGNSPAADSAEHDPGERREDRDREVAPVHRRVPEDGVDPEEGCVRVEHLHARVPEDVAGEPLVPPDQGVGERRRDQPAPEPGQPPSTPGQPREAERQQPEGQEERTEEDRPAADVDRPDEREPGPPHERREREGDRAELARAVVTAQERPAEREREPSDHRVEGQEEVDLVAPDVDGQPQGDARQRRQREQVRPPPEQYRHADGDDEPAHGRCGQPGAAEVGQEIDAQHPERGRPRDEAREAGRPGGPEVQRREPGGADDAGSLCGDGHEGASRTTTAARSTWPLASTSRV